MTRSLTPRAVRWPRVTAAVVLALSGAVAAFATIAPGPDAELLASKTLVPEAFPINAEALVQQAEPFVRQDRLLRGDAHAALLVRLGVTQSDIHALLRSGALRELRPLSTVTAELDGDGALRHLSFMNGAKQISVAPTAEGGFVARDEAAVFETRNAFKTSVVTSSLFAAADAADVPDAVAIQMAEIFAGDIDFHRDLRKGDRFSVIYEVFYLYGQPVRSGRVLATEFVNQGKVYRALWYAGPDGKGAYYTPEGKSLRKAFLRSPLEFSRISSGFGSRLHPFLQTWRTHKGVDYAAPAGTRIRAVADAVVEFIGAKGGYGNMVVLRHQGQYSTAYAHMSRFAPGLKRGARVSQGEPIGFVGQTGWATGPHLHYEFHVAGEARNPLTIALPIAIPILPAELAAYRNVAQPMLAQLDLLAGSRFAQLD